MNVPLRCTGGTKFGRGFLAVVTFGITEGKKVFYHHAFVAEGVNKYDANDKVYFVAQFFENEKIPKRHPTKYTMNSTDLQVLIFSVLLNQYHFLKTLLRGVFYHIFQEFSILLILSQTIYE